MELKIKREHLLAAMDDLPPDDMSVKDDILIRALIGIMERLEDLTWTQIPRDPR
tara:strand:- start:244 stop:405 length:162 start_codon:yes stop_codon:yes gene_type:complete